MISLWLRLVLKLVSIPRIFVVIFWRRLLASLSFHWYVVADGLHSCSILQFSYSNCLFALNMKRNQINIKIKIADVRIHINSRSLSDRARFGTSKFFIVSRVQVPHEMQKICKQNLFTMLTGIPRLMWFLVARFHFTQIFEAAQ